MDTSSVGARAVARQQTAKFQKIEDYFRENNALSESTAITLTDQEKADLKFPSFESPLSHFKKTSDGKYWMDLDWRRKVSLVVNGILIGILVVFIGVMVWIVIR